MAQPGRGSMRLALRPRASSSISTRLGQELWAREGRWILGKYQVGEPVGDGPFGIVYKGLHTETGEFRCLKQYPIHDGVKSHDIDLLERALDNVGEVGSSRVARVYEVLRKPDAIYATSDFIENGSIRELLDKYGSLSERRVAKYAIEILDALEDIHGEGVVHGALRGTNILIDQNGHLRLTDFGLFEARKGLAPGDPCAHWMAPESMAGGHASIRGDVYSLGCTLVEMITGRPPLYEQSEFELMASALENKDVPLPSFISEEMHDFLRRCLAPEAERRPRIEVLRAHPWLQRARTGHLGDGSGGDPASVLPTPSPDSAMIGTKRFFRDTNPEDTPAVLAALDAVRHDAMNVNRWRDVAVALYRDGQIERALQAWQRCALLDPLDAAFYLYMGMCHEMRLRFGFARQCYERALVVDPSYTPALFALSHALDQIGLREEARETREAKEYLLEFADALQGDLGEAEGGFSGDDLIADDEEDFDKV